MLTSPQCQRNQKAPQNGGYHADGYRILASLVAVAAISLPGFWIPPAGSGGPRNHGTRSRWGLHG